MDKPDFAKYSEEQLRQILTRIDAERFPDRVEEIKARLAQLEAERLARTESDEAEIRDEPAEIAGFWRRAVAFLIDSLVVGLVGYCLGLLLQDQFEAMGAWGRVVGFIVTLAYFGTMESRIFQGRTLGKIALDIKVVTAAGVPPSYGKALLRSAVFFIPYFLNNVALGNGSNFVLPAIQTLLVFGLGGTIAYLCVFNRRTRQSVHDLLVQSVVVRAGAAKAPSLLPVWRGHIAILAVLFGIAIGSFAYISSLFGQNVFPPLLQAQQQVGRIPGVRNASVVQGISFANGGKTSDLKIRAVLSKGRVDDQTLARSIAETALAAYPSARQFDICSVTLTRGYDIGIASNWRFMTFNGPPAAWRAARIDNDGQ